MSGGSLIEELMLRVSHAADPSLQTIGRNQAFLEAIELASRREDVPALRQSVQSEVILHDAVPLGQVWVHNPNKPKPLTRDELLAKHTVQELHDQFAHPDYEYLTVETGRKDGEDGRPGDDWEPNNCVEAGFGENKYRRNWDRGDYTEDNYWMRRTPSTQVEVAETS